MAKVSFAKLGIKVNTSIETLTFNDNTIEVKKYLPMQEKMIMITDIINKAADENKFYNPMKLEVFAVLEIIDRYTNLSIPDKQKKDPAKLFDLLVSSGLWDKVSHTIDEKELEKIHYSLKEVIKAIYDYQNSAMGILDTISEDYSNLKFDAESIKKDLADEGNLSLLKDIITKLG